MPAPDFTSNLAIIPFELDGESWHSAEQYFQAAKFTDAVIVEKIKACRSPYLCATLGQTRNYPLRADWETVKVAVMERAIRARFAQHPDLAERLRRSTGDLHDRTAADDFWGPGGENVTGQILMRIRAELNSHSESAG